MTARPPSKEQYLEVLRQCEETTKHVRNLQDIVQ